MSERGSEESIRETVAKTRIANDLALTLRDPDEVKRRRVIIEFNADFPGGEGAARALYLMRLLKMERTAYADILRPSWMAVSPLLEGMQLLDPVPAIEKDEVEQFNSLLTERYLFATLNRGEIFNFAGLRAQVPKVELPVHLVHKVWADQPVRPLVYVSGSTIKCDAARTAFNSAGQGIVWAVADTGVSDHPHFLRYQNLTLPFGIRHWDFTQGHNESPDKADEAARCDADGHGTHVAGIIAGSSVTRRAAVERGLRGSWPAKRLTITRAIRDHDGVRDAERSDPSGEEVSEISGVAPQCKILSLKVMSRGNEAAHASRLLAAIGYIQLLNGYGRHLKVHGLNLSVGYEFDPSVFSPGQSPLCQEVDRLVKSGVVVVAAAGNGGYGRGVNSAGESQATAYGSSIADPGNAELAITVGSTHRERPHTYGISFFSAKGPTADGRMKPDMVAPGERIVSCAPLPVNAARPSDSEFRELTGTSMAAPHVSGAIAAFLSVRREFRGRPEVVKKLFKANATDLGREPVFQGAGLVDLMRTLQAV